VVPGAALVDVERDAAGLRLGLQFLGVVGRIPGQALAKYSVQRFLSLSNVRRICEEATIIRLAPSTTRDCCIAASLTSRQSSVRAWFSVEARLSTAL
jgi:hypothetical protein